jgi:hypothetical protein
MKNIGLIILSCISILACTPKILIGIPDKPIEINLNIKIEHEIKLKVDKELDGMFVEQSELF